MNDASAPARPAITEADVTELVRSPLRLAAVRAARLLDSASEEDFDALTRLAQSVLGAAASFVSIVDVDRDFYKSQSGFPEPLASAREMPGPTFCHYAISGDRPLVIDDTHAKPVWKAVPTVESLGVRAYVGVPIMFDGQVIGSFCVIDSKPREWSRADIEIVGQFAKSASREIHLRAALAEAVAEGGRLRSMARANEELMAVAKHDLRSPIQAIAITAAILARSEDVAVQGHAKRLEIAAASMRSLVDGLLTAGAADPTQPAARKPVLAAKLLEDAAQTIAPIAGRAKVSLSLGKANEATVLVDYPQLLRALCNVTGNSVRYCPGSSVVLAAERLEGYVRLTVTDDGCGIALEDLPRLFERGFQGSNGVELGEGDGLGLSIVRSLVEGNGGSVSLSSAVGEGTSVEIRLPC